MALIEIISIMPVSILLGPRDISAITISNGGQDIVNDAVAELIKKMVTSPDFEKGIREKIAARVDTSELEQELDGLKKKMRRNMMTCKSVFMINMMKWL